MSILTILFALLLSGSATFPAHTNTGTGGGSTTTVPTSKTLPGMTVDDTGGGPTG